MFGRLEAADTSLELAELVSEIPVGLSKPLETLGKPSSAFEGDQGQHEGHAKSNPIQAQRPRTLSTRRRSVKAPGLEFTPDACHNDSRICDVSA